MILVVFLACSHDVGFQGTLVGNPGQGNAMLAEGKNLEFEGANGRATAVHYRPNTTTFSPDQIVEAPLDQDLNLLASGDEIPLQQGEWRSIALEFADGITVQGNYPDGTPFTLETSSLFVNLEKEGGFSISHGKYVIELGNPGWLSVADLEGETSVYADEDSPAVEKLNYHSGLYQDIDEDGQVSEQEREEETITDVNDDEIEIPEANTDEWEPVGNEMDFSAVNEDGFWEEWDEEWVDEEWDEEWVDEEWDEESDTASEASSGGCGERSTIWLPVLWLLGRHRRVRNNRQIRH